MSKSVPVLREFFEDRTDGELRSIIRYKPDGFETEYIRDDVAAMYTESEIETSVDEARMESLSAPIHENTFAEDHGNLDCMVKCFENVVEMNFVLGDGDGVTVALDEEALMEAHGLVVDARRIVLQNENAETTTQAHS